MENQEITFAFTRIREDMQFLLGQVNEIKLTKNLDFKIKEKLNELEKVDFTNIVKELDKKVENSHLLLKLLNNRARKVEQELRDVETRFLDYDNKISTLEKKVVEVTRVCGEKDFEIAALNDKFIDFEELVNEKMTIEIASLKLDLMTNLRSIEDRFLSNQLSLKSIKPPEEVKEDKNQVALVEKEEKAVELKGFSNYYQPLKKNSLENENYENEKIHRVVEVEESEKEEKPRLILSKPQSPTKEEELFEDFYSSPDYMVEKETTKTKTTKRESGRMKKAVDWLFDDDESDLKDIKTQVKK